MTSKWSAKTRGGYADWSAIETSASGPPVITTTALPDGAVGVAYSSLLSASGASPFTWAIDSGSLPSWATLNTSTGGISGEPDAPSVSSFVVSATNGEGVDTAPFSLTIPNEYSGGSDIVTTSDTVITVSSTATVRIYVSAPDFERTTTQIWTPVEQDDIIWWEV